MDKNRLLQQIANTIVSNLNGTEDVSLFHGKMGVCLFLYAYAMHTGKNYYERMASRMFNDACFADRKRMMSGVAEGYGGIGVGLCWLIQKGFIGGDAYNLLAEMDVLMIDNAEKCLRNDNLYAAPYFSSGVYLTWRRQLQGPPISEEIAKEIEETAYDKKDYAKQQIADFCSMDPDTLWWNFVLQNTEVRISMEEIADAIQLIHRNYVYEMTNINGQLSILGLYLLNQ
jgi:hypothetical protein